MRDNKEAKTEKYGITEETFDEVLPVVRPDQNEISTAQDLICTICFEEYSEEREYRITPCKHFFHYECIYAWLITNRKKKCPNDNFKFR